jgi:membrane protease YdiL (CAAX protease family)
MIAATCDVPSTNLLPAPAAPPPSATAQPRPWGFWATLGWGLLAACAGVLALIGYVVIWMLTHQLRTPDLDDAFHSELAGVVMWIAPFAVLAGAIAIKGASQREYFGLRAMSGRDLLIGVGCLSVLIAAFTALTTMFGIDDGSKFMETTYRASKLAGVLPLMWILVVIVAPVTEELLFRGFLHRGWSSSRLGAPCTIILTSGLWAILHQQYNWACIFFIFLMGLTLGWLRQRSGSTTLTIVLHGLNNLVSTIIVAVQLEWFS